MSRSLISPDDTPERAVEKLTKISDALMRRVEQASDAGGAGYAHFQQAVMLEEKIRARTRDLERTLQLLNESNARLAAANEAEQRARSDLSNALEAVQEGFAIFGPDDLMVMCNSRFCRPMPDVWERLETGISFNDYVELVSKSAHLDLSEIGDPQAWVDRRRRLHGQEHIMFNVRLKGGVVFQVSEHLTPDGGTAILQTDVTDMVLMERAERDKLLDDQARMVRATLDHINQGVSIFDDQARLIGWNKRLGALLSPPMHLVRLGVAFDLIFDHVERGVTFETGVTASDVRDWVASTGPREPLAFDMRRSGGVILSVFAQETPDHGFVISFTDVTAERDAVNALFEANETLERRVRERTLELEEAVSDAERANASKSRFVAAASHDLLQPLSAAKLFISSLETMPLGPTPKRAVLRAQNALTSVEGILGALLEISKLDSGRAVVERAPVALAVLLRQLEEEFAPIAAKKGLDLRIVSSTFVADSDPSYLRRILQNLISNAIRYTEIGNVLVGVRREEGAARVEVWDTGPGVPADRQGDIFKEFQRLDKNASPAEGMGLGLTIVDRACKLLDHELRLRSRPGLGSCFSITLPLADALASEPTRGGAPETPAPRANVLALIVENDAEVRDALTLLLETWGMEAFAVASAEEALALLDETDVRPDVMLVDYALDDGRTGVEAARDIRAVHGAIPTAVVTAARTPEIRAECRRARLPLIEKPIEPRRIFAFITEAAPVAG